jgi:RNA polymerase sigma factor (sigma-70 family)
MTLVDDQTPTPQSQAERTELWQAVAALPAPLRTAVEMYYRWDLTQEQIAATLCISQMQVSRRLTRARERLAESLAAAA